MSRARWQHLDRRKPADSPPAVAPPGLLPCIPGTGEDTTAPLRESTPPSTQVLHPALKAARGYYALGQHSLCVTLVTEALARHTELPGAQGLLGLALGCLGEWEDAIRALTHAVAEAPDQPQWEASLLSAQLRAGLAPEVPATPGQGPLAELRGAALWRLGQHALRNRQPRVAARHFTDAAALFAEASPLESRAERLAAAYIGQVISQLAAGDWDAAQQSFSRLQFRQEAPPATVRFAQELYAVAELARELPAHEQEEVLTPLTDLIAAARLEVAFYDQQQPVTFCWEHLLSR